MTTEGLRRRAELVGAVALLLAGCSVAPIEGSARPSAGQVIPPASSATPAVTLPPSLSGPAMEGTVVLDVADPGHVGEPGDRYTRDIGTAPPANRYVLWYGCIGAGEFSYSLGEQGQPGFHGSINGTPCDGAPRGIDLRIPSDTAFVVSIAADTTAAWRLILAIGPDDGSAQPALPAPASVELPSYYVPLTSTELAEGQESGTVTIRLPIGTNQYYLTVGCVGLGAVEVDTPDLTSEFLCNLPGAPGVLVGLVAPRAREFGLTIRQTGVVRSAVSVLTYDPALNADIVFVHPRAFLSDGTRLETVPGCGGFFELASGENSVTDCGPAYPVIPRDRALVVKPGEELTFDLDPGWSISQLTGQTIATRELIDDAEGGAFIPLADVQGESGKVTFGAPREAGDWTLQLQVEGVGNGLAGTAVGDRFGLVYYARVIVTP